MNMALRELYQDMIIDHNRHPRNHHILQPATATANGFNPLCGDKLTVYLNIEQDKIFDISFIGCGCAISQASASMMTEVVKNKTVNDAQILFKCFHKMLTTNIIDADLPEKLKVLSGVSAYPARVKCATLAWHTLDSALEKTTKTVSTE